MKVSTKEFLAALEVFANRKLNFPREVGELIELGASKPEVFQDIIFHAKFVTNSYRVMTRIGFDAEGYDKLSAEFKESLEKVSTLIKTLVKESADEIKTRFTGQFFRLDQESLSMLMRLLADLALVKNWMVDGKKLPT
ncbi:MAG TPA: hypothetical protein VNN76_11640 [Bacteroidota bacterium]|nr:hypothetical protein [Bacteroidota bacterium]